MHRNKCILIWRHAWRWFPKNSYTKKITKPLLFSILWRNLSKFITQTGIYCSKQLETTFSVNSVKNRCTSPLNTNFTINHIQSVCRTHHHSQALHHIQPAISDSVTATLATSSLQSHLHYINSVPRGKLRANLHVHNVHKIPHLVSLLVTRTACQHTHD